jgi:hypothetical protein
VTALSPGTTRIIARADGVEARCRITVLAAKVGVSKVSLNKTSLSLTVGDEEPLTATVSPDNATDKTVTWSSSNTGVAQVTSDGSVIARAAGTATITAKVADGPAATCTVTVKAATVFVTKVGLNKSSLSLTVGGEETLTATVSPDNATNKTVIWSSSNTGVAQVSGSGRVTGKAVGTATVTASSADGPSVACTVTVGAAAPAITFRINALDVVKDLKDGNGNIRFPSGTIDDPDARFRLRLFVYNSQGVRVAEETQIQSGFSETFSVTKNLAAGQYTVVTTADIVAQIDGVTTELWTFEGTSALSTLKIRDFGDVLNHYQVLGVYKSTLTVSGAQTVNANPQPAGALITLVFERGTSSNVAAIAILGDRWNNYYSVNESRGYVTTAASGEYQFVDGVVITNTAWTGYYVQYYLLPMTGMHIIWGTGNSNGDVLNVGELTFNVTKGVNSTYTVSTSTSKVTTRSAAQAGYSPALEGRQINVSKLMDTGNQSDRDKAKVAPIVKKLKSKK